MTLACEMNVHHQRAWQSSVHWLLRATLMLVALSGCDKATGSQDGSSSAASGSGAPAAGAALLPDAGRSSEPEGAAAAMHAAGSAAASAGEAGDSTRLIAGAAGNATPTAGSGDAGASAAGSPAGMMGTAGGSGSAGDAGAAGASDLSDCSSQDEPEGPCGTFTTQAGVKIQLGPYGAVVERNVGKGFEVPLASGDADDGSMCAGVVASFGEDPKSSEPLLDIEGIDFALYTVYRPAHWVEGETYPIITWGDGTCAKPEGYGALLRYVASHGFFVIAANSRWVGTNSAMTKALDFAFAANDDAQSPYYQRLDTSKVGAMGHSQGGMATISAARDDRVKTVIIWNGGSSAVKPFLAVSGDMDIGNPAASSLASALTGDPPGAYLFYHMVVGDGPVRGHLTLMTQPERVVEPATAWFKYQLLGDMDSRNFFVGDTCGLCDSPAEFDYGQKGLQ